MSIDQVQARTAEILSRIQSLQAGPPAGGALGVAAATDPTSADFSQTLSAATSQAGFTPPVTSMMGSLSAAIQPAAGDNGSAAVALATRQVGTPYVWGGAAPGGFDCSGLVQWTYGQLGVHLPRTAAEQARAGTAVHPADAQPGDLVCFARTGSVDHIGIYAGNGMMVVAPHTGANVRMERVDLATAVSIRRVTEPSPVVGSTTAEWARALPPAGQRFAPLIARAADQAGIPPQLLAAVAWTESGFDPGAVSPAGARGLVQLMPRTAEGLGVDATDPAQSLAGGARYLREQLDAFGGRTDLALAAYNAGPTAVRRAGGIPAYPETQAYVSRVLDHVRTLGGRA